MMLNNTCPCPCCKGYGICECDYGNRAGNGCPECQKCVKHCVCPKSYEERAYEWCNGMRLSTKYNAPSLTKLIEQVRAEGENAGLEKARQGIVSRMEYFKSIDETCEVYTCMTLLEDLDERIRAAKSPVAQVSTGSTVNHACHTCGKPVQLPSMTVCVACSDAE